MKILEIPKEFRQMLTPFRQFMAAPQFKHFTRYVFGLIVAEKKKKKVEGINAIYAERWNLARYFEGKAGRIRAGDCRDAVETIG